MTGRSDRTEPPASNTPDSRAERERSLLLRAGEVLAEAEDEGQAAAGFAALLVPDHADWCFVDVLESTSWVRRLAVAHADASRVAAARAIAERFPMDPEARFGPAPAIRSRTPDLAADIPRPVRDALPLECPFSRVVTALGIHSRVVVPLRGFGGVSGALTVAWAESPDVYSQADLPVLEELGRRLGVAFEALRLARMEPRPAATATPDLDRQLLARLSPREREVLGLVASGLSTRDIAEKLGLGVRTVETHRVHVLRKLGLKGAVDVVRFAARCGIIPRAESIP